MERREYERYGGPELVGFRGFFTEAHHRTRSVGPIIASSVGRCSVAR